MRELNLHELAYVSGGFNLGELTTEGKIYTTLGSGAFNGLYYAKNDKNPTMNGYIGHFVAGMAGGAIGVTSKNTLVLVGSVYGSQALGDKVTEFLDNPPPPPAAPKEIEDAFWAN